jgi:hypothetical protein
LNSSGLELATQAMALLFSGSAGVSARDPYSGRRSETFVIANGLAVARRVDVRRGVAKRRRIRL